MTSCRPNRRTFMSSGLCATLLPGAGWAQSTKRDVEGGLGGTGIVGVLVDFGSLILAGQTVQTDEQTRVETRFGPLPVDQLRAGDSLTVEAERFASDKVIARRVELTYPLVGVVTALDSSEGTLTVNGVAVFVETRITGFGIGDRVAVSGLWREDTVVASRISKAPGLLDLVAGTVGRGYVSGVQLSSGATTLGQSGRFATVVGRFDTTKGAMDVQKIEFDRFTGAAGPLKSLSVEGWLEPTSAAPGFRIAGLGHSFARNLNLAPFQDQRVLFSGPYTGRFAANSALVLPDNPGARRRLLLETSL